jgi:hypothetical protein
MTIIGQFRDYFGVGPSDLRPVLGFKIVHTIIANFEYIKYCRRLLGKDTWLSLRHGCLLSKIFHHALYSLGHGSSFSADS